MDGGIIGMIGIILGIIMGIIIGIEIWKFPESGRYPKMDDLHWKNMENPTADRWFGGTPTIGNLHMGMGQDWRPGGPPISCIFDIQHPIIGVPNSDPYPYTEYVYTWYNMI